MPDLTFFVTRGKGTMMKKIFLLCLIIFITTACLSTCGSPQRPAFERNLALWQSLDIQHYRFHLEIGCNCPWRSMMPVSIEVKNGGIVSMVASNGGDITPFLETFRKHGTIDSLFDLLDGTTSTRVYRLEVQYDSSYGFPTNIVIDPYKMITDDATGYYVTDFEVLP
jgi:hypothetical protein